MEELQLKINGEYSMYEISSFLAHTVKREIKLKQKIGDRFTFAQRGKRKQYYLDLNKNMVLIEGWNLPLLVDSDTHSFSGNACFNFLGTTDFVREWLGKSLTKFDKGCVLAVERFPDKPEVQNVVYLEEAQGRGHAVVNRILNRMGVPR